MNASPGPWVQTSLGLGANTVPSSEGCEDSPGVNAHRVTGGMGGVGGHSKQNVVLCVFTCLYSCGRFILHYPSGKGRTQGISASLTIIFLPSF